MYISGIHGSHLEGVVFEQLFGRPSGAGVSAIQILRDANAARVPIYRITAANLSDVMPNLALSAQVEADISNAVIAGKEVIAPQYEVPHGHGGWQGTGYLVLDPQTGAGAYLIDGGLNGGSDTPCDGESSVLPLVEIIVSIVLTAILIAIFVALLPEVIAGIAVAGSEVAAIIRTAVVASGLLTTAAAEASFNRNAACLRAIETATSSYEILQIRIAEYLAAPVRDAGHYAAIQQRADQLEEAIGTINRCCRVKPPTLSIWQEAVVEARALPPP